MPTLKQLLPEVEKAGGVKGEFGGALVQVPRIPTGILELDLAIGGGMPKGRMVEIFGPEGSGKTNLALATIREAQRFEPKAKQAFIDVEGTWDPVWATRMGVDVSRVYVIRPTFAEQASDTMQKLILADDLNVIVLDSIAAMCPEKEAEEDSSTQFYGGASRTIKRMTQKVTVELNKRRNANAPAPVVIWINQTRANFQAGTHGNPEKTPGGKSPMFAYSLRLRTYSNPIILSDVSKSLPAIRETSVVVKKYKVPVTALQVKFKLVMLPHKDLTTGEVDSWHTVENILKASGVLSEPNGKGKGWLLIDTEFKTLKAARQRFREDHPFRMMLTKGIIDAAVAANGFVQEDSALEVDEPYDPETGELSP